MRRPDFFIVGAPKCGTTAMDQYLGAHPQIFMPDRKESHFFGSDLEIRYDRLTEEEYLSYFRQAGDALRAGESSVFYLVSRNAAAEIRAFSPDARVLIMLRDPVEVLHSMHSQVVYMGMENLQDFAAALAAELDRKAHRNIPDSLRVGQALHYRDLVRYTDQVRRYLDAFGRERVHVIVFDDFKADTAREYRRTLEFLGVDAEFAPPFDAVNANKRVRSGWMQRLVFNNPLTRTYRVRRFIPEAIRNGVRNLITVREPRPPMDPELRSRLQAEFAPEVERLSELLQRDLTHWSRDRRSAATATSPRSNA